MRIHGGKFLFCSVSLVFFTITFLTMQKMRSNVHFQRFHYISKFSSISNIYSMLIYSLWFTSLNSSKYNNNINVGATEISRLIRIKFTSNLSSRWMKRDENRVTQRRQSDLIPIFQSCSIQRRIWIASNLINLNIYQNFL